VKNHSIYVNCKVFVGHFVEVYIYMYN